jgi:hypothetical protein
VSDLCTILHRSREDITLGLYILQKNGIIEYKLALPSLGITLLPKAGCLPQIIAADATVDTFDTVDAFISDVSQRVYKAVVHMNTIESQRLFDMWELATAVLTSTADKDEEASSQSQMDKQAALRDRLDDYMNADCDDDSTNNSGIDSNDDSISAVAELIPLKARGSGKKYLTPSSTELESLRREIVVLNHDIRLNSIVKGIILRAFDGKGLGSVRSSYNITSRDSIRLKSCFCARVLHGLGSTLIPASLGRESFPAWGRYTNFLFSFLEEFSYLILQGA